MAVFRDVYASFPVIQRVDYAVKAVVASINEIIPGDATVVCNLLDTNGQPIAGQDRTFTTAIPGDKLADFHLVCTGQADQTIVDEIHTLVLNSNEADGELPIV